MHVFSHRTGTSCHDPFLISLTLRSYILNLKKEENTHTHARAHTRIEKVIGPLWCMVCRLGLCELLMWSCVFVCGLYFAFGFAALSNQPKYMTSSSCSAPPPCSPLLHFIPLHLQLLLHIASFFHSPPSFASW